MRVEINTLLPTVDSDVFSTNNLEQVKCKIIGHCNIKSFTELAFFAD